MRCDTLIFIALLWPCLLAGQVTGTGSISGAIINSATSAPISSASVVLHLNTADDLAATAATDGEGRFSFGNLPPGIYLLEARHTGFDTTWFGSCPGEEQGVPFGLRAGEKRGGVSIVLPPLAVITGTVTSQDGEPIPRAFVAVHSTYAPPGTRVSKRLYGRTASTDARGRFRVFGIPAGTYFVSAYSSDTVFLGLSSDAGQQDPQSTRYEPVYYPGTPSRYGATAITLTAGELRENIDFQLPVVHSVKIEATVQPPSDLQEAMNFRAELASAFENSLMQFGFSTGGSTKNPLHFDDVFPGRYYLHVVATKNGRSFGSYSRIDISNDETLRKLTVQLTPPVDVHGTIRIDSSPADPKCCRISLKARDEVAFHDSDPLFASRLPDGSFTFANVVPGPWSVDIQSIPDGSYVKSVRFAGKDVFHEDLIVDAETAEPLEIVIGARAAEISGVVTNAKGGKVLLAPPHDTEKTYLYHVVSVEPDGRFHIRGLPPGSYNLFALRTLEDDAWLDPDFRARMKGAGTAVELRDGSKLETTLTAIDPKSANCREQIR